MLKILLIVFAILLSLFVLSVRGRKGHPGLKQLQGWCYAHRGLHNASRPENSMAAFEAALEQGYGIELDVHLLKDGTLAVMHDSALLRTTGRPGRIEDLTADHLCDYVLEGTDQTIPSFQQVLRLLDGRVPLIVELKSVDNNYAQLTQTACRMLQDYPGPYCVESFDPRCVRWLRKNRPQVIRGQLTENFVAGKGPLPWVLKFALTHQLLNFLTLPDFVSYRFCDRKTLSNFLVRKLWGIQGVTWTVKDPDEHRAAVQAGWIPIFENYTP